MRGGWYSDFNDTYCFGPLTYVHEGEADGVSKIYLGCDATSDTNNYIMYSPINHPKLLENTLHIIKESLEIYKILQYKDTEHFEYNKNILQEILNSIQDCSKETLLERMFPKIHEWTERYNNSMKELLKRRDIKITSLFTISFNVFLIYIQYIFKAMNPSTKVIDILSNELQNVSFLPNKRKNSNIRWKRDKPILTSEDMLEIQNLQVNINPELYYNYIIRINKQNILNITNMGAYFLNKNKEHCFYIPYCFLLRGFNFLTILGHIGDSSCQGFGANTKYEDTSI